MITTILAGTFIGIVMVLICQVFSKVALKDYKFTKAIMKRLFILFMLISLNSTAQDTLKRDTIVKAKTAKHIPKNDKWYTYAGAIAGFIVACIILNHIHFKSGD
jgi:Mn2+/Fe2+ NRAMP family transporter